MCLISKKKPNKDLLWSTMWWSSLLEHHLFHARKPQISGEIVDFAGWREIGHFPLQIYG